jgi:hypothetical protein
VTRAGRRALLRLAGLAATMPLMSIVAAAAQPVGGFAPPTEPMRYRRRLERELAGGARLIVTRSFAVRFVREADGYRVEGEQLEVEVDAPEQLAALASLERQRVEIGLFPLSLDAAGAIRGAPRAGSSEQLYLAVREVADRIERGKHTPAERDTLRAFVEAVHQSAGELVTELPRDLFAPAASPREDHRVLALPGGDAGQVRVTFTATSDPATGLMREARREVVTEVAGDRRHTVESWSLAPLVA